MSYFNQIKTTYADSPNVDAFQRLRVSEPTTTFDNKQLYGDNQLVWTTYIQGNSTSSFLTNNACMVLSSSATSSVVRQTRKRHVYQPGKSQFIMQIANFNQSPTVGVIKRIGYFDQNNGIGFMASGSSFGVFLRTNTSGTPVDTFISQSAWNLDTMTGTGVSGNTLNITSSQIYLMDFEWLGVGRTRYGLYQNGVLNYVHQIINTNTLSTVYMSSPNQPVRYEVINSGSATPQTLTHICSTVVSEGGIQNNGAVKSISNDAALSLTAGNYYGLIALRLFSGSLDSNIIPLNGSTAAVTMGPGTSIYEQSLLLNPSGSLPWVWQNIPNSPVQYATGSAAFIVTTEGTKLGSTVTAAGSSTAEIEFDPTIAIGSDVTGSQDILVLALRDIASNLSSVAGSITWREVS